MRHENSVFHQIQKHVPWAVFERLVDKYKGDHRVRRLPMKSQFLALLFAQLSGAASLREIEAGLSSHEARLYHLGGRCVARTPLPRQRPAGLLPSMPICFPIWHGSPAAAPAAISAMRCVFSMQRALQFLH